MWPAWNNLKKKSQLSHFFFYYICLCIPIWGIVFIVNWLRSPPWAAPSPGQVFLVSGSVVWNFLRIPKRKHGRDFGGKKLTLTEQTVNNYFEWNWLDGSTRVRGQTLIKHSINAWNGRDYHQMQDYKAIGKPPQGGWDDSWVKWFGMKEWGEGLQTGTWALLQAK